MPVIILVLLFLVRVDRFIFNIQLLVPDHSQCLQNDGLLLPFNDWCLHGLRSVVSVDLPSRGSLGLRVVFVQLLLELKVFFLEYISDFLVGLKLS